MTYLEAIILGLVQGLTEFLPISSSAHLRIAGLFMGFDPGAAFSAITQIGTETAVLIYFRRDIYNILRAFFSSFIPVLRSKFENQEKNDARLGWWIILGSIPIGILGLAFQTQIEHALRNLWITAVVLIAFGLFLGWADLNSPKNRQLKDMKSWQAVSFGLFQALALIPGVSRSGGTITGGRLMGFSRQAAARYSFLLAIPAVLASGGYQLYKSLRDPSIDLAYGPTALATLVAFGVGFWVIVAFMKLVETWSLRVFVWYRVVLGLVIIFLLLANIVPALDPFCTGMK